MDNGSYSSNSEYHLQQTYPKIQEFGKYQFELQQFFINIPGLQDDMDKMTGENTPTEVKVLDIWWDRHKDVYKAVKINQNISVDSTR